MSDSSNPWMVLLCPVHYIPGAMFVGSILLSQHMKAKTKSKRAEPPTHSGAYISCSAWITINMADIPIYSITIHLWFISLSHYYSVVFTGAFDVKSIARRNILSLEPYRCARDDYSNGVLLDANENAFGPGLNAKADEKKMELHRYPDPLHLDIKKKVLMSVLVLLSYVHWFMYLHSSLLLQIELTMMLPVIKFI